jgi:hypothetical protein
MRRLVRAAAIVALALLVLGACSKDERGDEPAAKSAPAAEPADQGETVTATSDPPRSSGYTAAREDITALTCTRKGDSWQVVGTVENPTDVPADYRIYTLLLDGDDAVKGIAQADVEAVGANQAKEWTASIDLARDGLRCGVRVERTPAA